MSKAAEKTNPELWDKVKKEVTAGDKGGRAGEWSARKAQLAVQHYKAEGGGYKGKKSADNGLTRWTDEKWGTKSGKKSADTGERYLPEEARKSLTEAEYERTTTKKRRDTRAGKQHSAQPADVAKKAAAARKEAKPSRPKTEDTRAELYRRAQAKNIPGRSRMTKEQLKRELSR